MNSKLIKNNDLLKQQFHYDYCQIKCKHGTKQRSNKVDNSRPNQHSYISGCQFGGNLTFSYHLNQLYFSKVYSTKHSNPPVHLLDYNEPDGRNHWVLFTNIGKIDCWSVYDSLGIASKEYKSFFKSFFIMNNKLLLKNHLVQNKRRVGLVVYFV